MARKLSEIPERCLSKIKFIFRRAAAHLGCTRRSPEEQSDGSGEADVQQGKAKPIIVKVNDMAITVNTHRKSIASSLLHKRRSASLDNNRPKPVLPPELIEKIASFLSQYDLLRFCRVSRDGYTAAERHLYRRPFTRRFDRLLRTLERSSYKADLILELALGFETDFYSVK
jgi:hypothetical protein